jgi:uncharacterized protein (DUF697 family)
MEIAAPKTPFLAALEPERAEELARGSSEEKAAAVQDLIRKTSSTAGATVLQPVPVLDVAFLTPLHRRLVRSIAVIHGCHLSDEDLDRMFNAMRRPLVASHTMLVLSKLVQWIPWAPEIFAVSLAYALTFALGDVCDQYLSQPDMPVEELGKRVEEFSRERFAMAFKVKRQELRAVFHDPEKRHRVKELKKARRQGKVDDDGEARALDALLGEGREPQRHQCF